MKKKDVLYVNKDGELLLASKRGVGRVTQEEYDTMIENFEKGYGNEK